MDTLNTAAEYFVAINHTVSSSRLKLSAKLLDLLRSNFAAIVFASRVVVCVNADPSKSLAAVLDLGMGLVIRTWQT